MRGEAGTGSIHVQGGGARMVKKQGSCAWRSRSKPGGVADFRGRWTRAMGGNKLEKNLSTLQGRVKRRQSQVQTRGQLVTPDHWWPKASGNDGTSMSFFWELLGRYGGWGWRDPVSGAQRGSIGGFLWRLVCLKPQEAWRYPYKPSTQHIREDQWQSLMVGAGRGTCPAVCPSTPAPHSHSKNPWDEWACLAIPRESVLVKVMGLIWKKWKHSEQKSSAVLFWNMLPTGWNSPFLPIAFEAPDKLTLTQCPILISHRCPVSSLLSSSHE